MLKKSENVHDNMIKYRAAVKMQAYYTSVAEPISHILFPHHGTQRHFERRKSGRNLSPLDSVHAARLPNHSSESRGLKYSYFSSTHGLLDVTVAVRTT